MNDLTVFSAVAGSASSLILPGPVANDNNAAHSDDALLNAALRHFAEHGMAAASHARRRAEAAFFAGDRDAYRWWLGVCRTLDRRLARELAAGTKDAG